MLSRNVHQICVNFVYLHLRSGKVVTVKILSFLIIQSLRERRSDEIRTQGDWDNHFPFLPLYKPLTFS